MKTFAPSHLKRWSLPGSYFGAQWPDYYSTGFGQSRDSDCLEESNFATVLAKLKALPPFVHPLNASGEVDNEIESRFVVRESHWAVGWVEWIAIHEADTAALELCDKLRGDYESYPVLDDEDYSNREQEAANQIWRDCYRQADRVKYVRAHRSQFDFRGLRDAVQCLRGDYFAGYASELLN
jgi:hypothetical protein